ncbi:hypothetical protein [Nonomuraea sp. NPDC048916]|uniref:hypothetical protein n=1 Tax=Nonomuraea sp. NPDC048916 TaxID=3154232 RepID=UPI0033FB81FF
MIAGASRAVFILLVLSELGEQFHQVFEPAAWAVDGLAKALAAARLLEDARAMDLRRPQRPRGTRRRSRFLKAA